MFSGMHGYVMTGRMSDFTSSVLDGMDSFFRWLISPSMALARWQDFLTCWAVKDMLFILRPRILVVDFWARWG